MKSKYFLPKVLLVVAILFFANTLKVSADTTEDQIKNLQSEIEQLNQQLINLSSDQSLPADAYISYIKNNKDAVSGLNSVVSISEQLDLVMQNPLDVTEGQ